MRPPRLWTLDWTRIFIELSESSSSKNWSVWPVFTEYMITVYIYSYIYIHLSVFGYMIPTPLCYIYFDSPRATRANATCMCTCRDKDILYCANGPRWTMPGSSSSCWGTLWTRLYFRFYCKLPLKYFYWGWGCMFPPVFINHRVPNDTLEGLSYNFASGLRTVLLRVK